MTARVVLASRNAHKIEELRRILADAGLDIELVGEDAFAHLPDIPETGSTFAANALIKARAVCAATGLPAVADDSGLAVDALNGMPGVLSARWAGRPKDDVRNVQLLLEQLEDVPDGRRSAAFHCAAALVLPDGTERVVEGTMEGAIIREPRGTNGFGYDPVFTPLGSSITSAEMTSEAKDAISHRGVAMRALVPVLREILAS